MSTLTIHGVSAAHVPQADESSDTDPYVRFVGPRSTTETHFLTNVLGRRGNTATAANALQWDGQYTMDVPFHGPVLLEVSLWDCACLCAAVFLFFLSLDHLDDFSFPRRTRR